MPGIQENVSLLPFNTFKIDVRAKFFAEVRSIDDAQQLFRSDIFRNNPHMILGGGSNILLTGDFNGLVIRNLITGIDVISEDDTSVTLKVGSGESWHELVMFAVGKNYGGIENLSLIPGTVGAAPMQNIGAYGVEVREVIHKVEAIEISTGTLRTFDNRECEFGYRESIFKQRLKGKYFISSITLSLTKTDHKFNIHYGSIREVLEQTGENFPSIKKISDAVISIRKSKLPDPNVIGNAGSFFKNPTIDRAHFEKLRTSNPEIPFYPAEDDKVKIPAAWLIEKSGWKGKTLENIGVHKHQALVLVNYGGGQGKKIWELAMNIQKSVNENFGITLQPEVNIV